MAVDGSGNLYVADSTNCRIRKVGGGTITTVAGNGTCGFSGDGGAATSASLSLPRGVALDAGGNLYIADYSNCRIRQVSGGTITTVAGSATCGFSSSGDGGAATSASLSFPRGVALDAGGNLYIAEGCSIRKVSGGTITTVAGNGACGSSGDGGAATSASLGFSDAVAVGGSGDFYITDGCRIRQVSGGIITTVAGVGTCGYGGDGGAATSATLSNPADVAVDGGGVLYIADNTNCRIRKVSAGTITTVAGNGACGFSGDGGAATSASLYSSGVAVDGGSNLYIADYSNCRIRKVSGGTITTVAGNGTCGYSGDGGPATTASLSFPNAVAVDGGGNLYIADSSNCRIRKVSGGTITTFAGSGTCGFSGDGGAATSATLSFQGYGGGGVAADGGGNLYIADSCRVRKVSSGTITTFAGNGICGFSGDGGAATSASLDSDWGVAVDGGGNLYIVDSGSCRIREVSGGTITTVAGNGTCGFSGDGGAATSATLSFQGYGGGVAVDGGSNLYIADVGNCRIRKVSGGTITTVAGNGTCGFSGDGGAATSASLSSPRDVALDAGGNLYIADVGNCRIRKVSGGVIATVAGNGTCGFSGDGGVATSASLNFPRGVAVGAGGNLYIADSFSNRIRKVTPSSAVGGISEQPDITALPLVRRAASGPTWAWAAAAALAGLALGGAVTARGRGGRWG